MRLSVVLLFLVSALRAQNFETRGLGSVLENIFINQSLQHVENARKLEAAGQYREALPEYTQVINDANQALTSNRGPSQDPVIYYILGLAHTDSARMLTYLNVSNLLRDVYLQHLTDADRYFRTADEMYRQRHTAMWAIPGALATVHILQGDLAATQVDMQRMQAMNPRYQPARAAAEQVATAPSAVVSALAAIRARIGAVTPAQWALVGVFVKQLAAALCPPQVQKGVTIGIGVTAAGYELYSQWQKQAGAAK
jgi:hypothetical protein